VKRLVAILASVASLACLGAEPTEAISFDRPIRVINEKNEVRWISDGGTCLSPPAWAQVDDEFKKLQTIKSQHENEKSPAIWFVAGAGTGAAIAIGVVIAAWFVTK
jgi:hypothetical protein